MNDIGMINYGIGMYIILLKCNDWRIEAFLLAIPSPHTLVTYLVYFFVNVIFKIIIRINIQSFFIEHFTRVIIKIKSAYLIIYSEGVICCDCVYEAIAKNDLTIQSQACVSANPDKLDQYLTGIHKELQYIPRNMHTVLLCFALLWLCNRS